MYIYIDCIQKDIYNNFKLIDYQCIPNINEDKNFFGDLEISKAIEIFNINIAVYIQKERK